VTYSAFLLVFLVPPVALLGWRRSRVRGHHCRAELRHLAWMAGIAVAWTTPWDNYLVWRGIWTYGPERVVATIGYVPLEEYVFFVLQPLLAGLLYLEVEDRTRPGARGNHAATTRGRPGPAARVLGAAFWLACAGAAVPLLGSGPGLYLGLILVWTAPVLAGQWAWAGGPLVARREPLIVTVAAVSGYLWAADRVAISLGIWEISAEFTTGLHVLGLPVEEAAFFLLTTLLVVQGLVLFRNPPSPAGPPEAGD
jgi:lycopene cyclase domain-containing protein